jgi:hypothetical protein
MDSVLVFDPAGTRLAALKPYPPTKLEGVTALVHLPGKIYVLSAANSRVIEIDL